MYSNNQKRFLSFLLNYKKDEITLSFSEVLYEYILNNYNGFIIEIEDDNISCYKRLDFKTKFSPNEIKSFQEDIVSILYLIHELVEKKYIIFYGHNSKVKNKYLERIDRNDFLFDMKLDFLEKLKDNFLKNYLITYELRELEDNKFQSIEQQNLKYTLLALYASIGCSILGIIVNIILAFKVTTVIEFKNPEQLKNASSTTIINMGKK